MNFASILVIISEIIQLLSSVKQSVLQSIMCAAVCGEISCLYMDKITHTDSIHSNEVFAMKYSLACLGILCQTLLLDRG